MHSRAFDCVTWKARPYNLRKASLNEPVGRLDKNTWRSIEDWPLSLQSFELDIAESGTHHS